MRDAEADIAADAAGRLTAADTEFQDQYLQGVSRTFALTLQLLPRRIRDSSSNAYLLCRINDTIEDEAALSAVQKQEFFDRFAAVVAGREEPEAFAREFRALLSDSTTEDEHDLITDTPRVVRITHGFNAEQRRILERCVRIMGQGMAEFQRGASLRGLDDLPHFDRYCYYVAGVVGETMTELFCEYSAEIAEHRDELMELSISFGQGLQMTNILKDMWEDRRRGACWLPRETFRASGFDLDALASGETGPGFVAGLFELLGLARHHLARALRYILLIPRRETGIRLFCLWTAGMAVLTLRRIHATPEFRSGQEVKISRRSVRAALVMSRLAVRSNLMLKLLFALLARRLPNGGGKFPQQAASSAGE